MVGVPIVLVVGGLLLWAVKLKTENSDLKRKLDKYE